MSRFYILTATTSFFVTFIHASNNFQTLFSLHLLKHYSYAIVTFFLLCFSLIAAFFLPFKERNKVATQKQGNVRMKAKREQKDWGTGIIERNCRMTGILDEDPKAQEKED